MRHRKTWLMVIIVLGLSQALLSQNKQDYHWVMGYGGKTTHPEFSGTDWVFSEDSLRLVRVDREVDFFVTNFSLSDSKGELKMYSNGCTIYNGRNEVIENGDTINYSELLWMEQCAAQGYIQPQGGVFFRFNNNGVERNYTIHTKVEYFPEPNITVGTRNLLFTKVVFDTAINDLKATIIDSLVIDTMLQGGHLKSIKHANGEDWWVIQPGRYDNRYFTLKITETGIDTVFVQTVVGGGIQPGGDGGGQAAFSPNGLMYARFDITENGFLLMDFDRETGHLSNGRHFAVNDEPNGVTGGCSFSPNSRFLYISASSKVYQYDLESTDVQASQTIVAEWDGYLDPFPTNFYLCNLGPDCRIYINSSNSVKSMHVIRYPDRKGLACEVAQHSIHLPTYNFASMPNFPHYRMDEDWPCDSTIGVKLVTSTQLPRERVEFEIWPNPADDVLHLEYALNGITEMQFELYDSFGRRVKSIEITYREFGTTLGIGELTSGTYYYRLFNDTGAFASGKVVVE